MKRTLYIAPLVIIAVYGVLSIFPLKLFYRFDNIKVKPFNPSTRQLIEVRKAFFLLPGPRSLWAVRTQTGYVVYANFGAAANPEKAKPVFSVNMEKARNNGPGK